MQRHLIAKEVLDIVQDYLDSQGEDAAQSKANESMLLVGSDAIADSLGLISIIVDVESRFRDQGFETLTLTSDDVLVRPDSPFQTVATLIDFVVELTA